MSGATAQVEVHYHGHGHVQAQPHGCPVKVGTSKVGGVGYKKGASAAKPFASSRFHSLEPPPPA